MAEGVSPSTDVNTSPVSSPEAQPVAEVSTPPAENAGSTEAGSKSVPYPRFKEVIDLKNQYERELAELRSRTAVQPEVAPKSNLDPIIEAEVQALVNEGLSREGAEKLLLSVDRVQQARMAPIKKQREIDAWLGEFAQRNTDFTAVEPEMTRIFASLPKDQQARIASSPEGIELLYHRAKAANQSKDLASAKATGRSEAYQTMALKGAMSSTPGSVPPNGAITRESLMAMSPEERVRRRPEIREAYEKGLIK